MQEPATFVERLRNREVTIGSWLQIGHPASAELLARAGFEWLAVDLEHTEIDLGEFASLARGIVNGGSVPMVRVRENDTLAIRQALDVGAVGVIVPMIDDAIAAEKAVRAAKYPPRGVRGFGFARANGYGAQFDTYAAAANQKLVVIAQAESKAAVDNIDEILSVDGLDGVFIGPYDLSASLGVVGQTGHRLVTEAGKTVVEACRKAGKAAGIHIVLPYPGAVQSAVLNGYTLIALGVDAVFLRQGGEAALGEAKADVTEKHAG